MDSESKFYIIGPDGPIWIETELSINDSSDDWVDPDENQLFFDFYDDCINPDIVAKNEAYD